MDKTFRASAVPCGLLAAGQQSTGNRASFVYTSTANATQRE